MTNTPEQQALLERLLGRLLLANRNLKVTTYDRPEVTAGHRVLLRLDGLTPEDQGILEGFMVEHGSETFGFATHAQEGNAHTLLLGEPMAAKACEGDGVTETRQRDLWRFGTLRHKGATYAFEAKVYDEGSQYGIRHGRISKLAVKELVSQETLLHYDRGWDKRPATAHAKAVLNVLLKAYPET